MVTVKEELAQFNYLFKMLLGIHEEYNALLENEEIAIYDNCFDDLDNRLCAFKRKTITGWLDSSYEECRSSRHSSRSSRSHRSTHSNISLNTKRSKSSKALQEKEVEDRVKMAELLAEVQHVEQRQQLKHQGEMLKIKQEFAQKYNDQKRTTIRK